MYFAKLIFVVISAILLGYENIPTISYQPSTPSPVPRKFFGGNIWEKFKKFITPCEEICNGLSCDKGRNCIRTNQICDCKADCKDGSDEAGCKCTGTQCRDANGACVDPNMCDCVVECCDGSDEADCERCPVGECRNHEGNCGQFMKCDNVPDCCDGSDEDVCFKCTSSDSGQIVSIEKICDGSFDCDSHLDEVFCVTGSGCTIGTFPCLDGITCLPQSQICDGTKQCPDGEDEFFCDKDECPGGRFRCPSDNTCITTYFVCDGDTADVECRYFEDETICGFQEDNFGCILGQFKCPEHMIGGGFSSFKYKCIDISKICDGPEDCASGMDERLCLSGIQKRMFNPPWANSTIKTREKLKLPRGGK